MWIDISFIILGVLSGGGCVRVLITYLYFFMSWSSLSIYSFNIPHTKHYACFKNKYDAGQGELAEKN